MNTSLPTFLEHFRNHSYHEKYLNLVKDETQAYRLFFSSNYNTWMNDEFAMGKDVIMSEKEVREFARDRLVGSFLDYDIKRCLSKEAGDEYFDKTVKTYAGLITAVLASGAKNHRWKLPVVEGILTEDYWIDESAVALEKVIESHQHLSQERKEDNRRMMSW